MNSIEVVQTIKQKFAKTGSPVRIPLQKGGFFEADLTEDGVKVNNLGNQPLLAWIVFQETICVLIRNGGRAR